jgi:hypothetical protein
VYNLQKLSITSFVKNNIIPAIPNCHIKAHTPMRTRNLTCLFTPFNEFPKRFLIFVGGGITGGKRAINPGL